MRRQNTVFALGSVKCHSSTIMHELWALYEQAMKRRGLSSFTIKHERENYLAITRILPGEQGVASFTSEDFEQVFDHMRALGLSAVTINGRIKTLRRMLTYAQQHDLLVVNHAVRVEKMQEVEKPIHSLTLADVKNLRQQPDIGTFAGLRNRTMIDLVFDCGIRLREMLDLTVHQVDLTNRRLRDVHRKTRKIVDIPISRAMAQSLARYLQERGTVDTPALFITVDETPLSRRTFQSDLKHYGERASIQDVRVSPHTLRHTFAKFYILNGGDPFSLQHILGHSDMGMVKRYVTMWGHEVQEKHDKYSPMSTLED